MHTRKTRNIREEKPQLNGLMDGMDKIRVQQIKIKIKNGPTVVNAQEED
jgi:hypothetical protein